MCGGSGRRMNLPFRGEKEKPMVRVCGKRLIEHPIEAIEEIGLEILALTSPKTCETEKFLRERGLDVVTSPGLGFVEDIVWFVREFRYANPILIVSADIVFLKNELIRILEFYLKSTKPAITAVKNSKNVGINIIDGYHSLISEFQPEEVCNVRWVFNVNTREDVKIVEEIAKKFNILK